MHLRSLTPRTALRYSATALSMESLGRASSGTESRRTLAASPPIPSSGMSSAADGRQSRPSPASAVGRGGGKGGGGGGCSGQDAANPPVLLGVLIPAAAFPTPASLLVSVGTRVYDPAQAPTVVWALIAVVSGYSLRMPPFLVMTGMGENLVIVQTVSMSNSTSLEYDGEVFELPPGCFLECSRKAKSCTPGGAGYETSTYSSYYYW